MASWLDLAALAFQYWGQKKRDDKAGDTKPIPLTPEEQWIFNTGKDTWKYSPARDFGSEIAYQQIQGMNQNQFNPKYASKAMQGQSLPQMPALDFSKIPKYWRGEYQAGKPGAGAPKPAGPSSPPAGSTGGLNDVLSQGGIRAGLPGGRGANGPLNRVEPPEVDSYGRPIDGPRYGEGIGDYLTRNPGGDPASYLPNQGSGARYDPNGGVWTTSNGDKLFLPPEKYSELTTPPSDVPQQMAGGWKGLIDKGLDAVAKNGVKWLIQGGVGVLTGVLTGGNVGLAGLAGKAAGYLYAHFAGNGGNAPAPAPAPAGGGSPPVGGPQGVM